MQPIPYPIDYPSEYISGKVNFFGRDFVVTPDVLIPRLETEVLVKRARQILRSNPQIIVIDIGCGSGIIGTSVADLADGVIFLDISAQALSIAQSNFRTHFPDKKSHFIVSDLLSSFQLPASSFQHSNILFLTNLPYIKADDWIHMSPDTVHEPRLALFGGQQTGFEIYEKLFGELSILLPSLLGEGLGVRCIFEFGFDQRSIAEEVLKKYPQWEYSFFADYAGVERFGEISI